MNHSHLPRLFFTLTLFLTLPLLSGCPLNGTGNTIGETVLHGDWNMKSMVPLETGDKIDLSNDYTFRPDKTFTNISHVKLIDGATNELLYQQTTEETGTWTIDGNDSCWTTSEAKIIDFDSRTPLITREMIEQELENELPPECLQIVSASHSKITLRLISEGGTVILVRK